MNMNLIYFFVLIMAGIGLIRVVRLFRKAERKERQKILLITLITFVVLGGAYAGLRYLFEGAGFIRHIDTKIHTLDEYDLEYEEGHDVFEGNDNNDI